MQKYHIKPDGTPDVCKAEKGLCKYANTPHFDSINDAQNYADEINELELNKNTSKTKLYKVRKIHDIIESKNYNKRLSKVNEKIGRMIDTVGYDAYMTEKKRCKKAKKRYPPHEKFIKNFMQTNPDMQYLIKKRDSLQEEIYTLTEHRFQANEIQKDTSKYLEGVSYSLASSSAYFLYKAEHFKEVKDYYIQKGYNIEINENAIIDGNFLVRISNHKPGPYLRRINKNSEVWEHTDATILVDYKESDKKQKINNRTVLTNLRTLEKIGKF